MHPPRKLWPRFTTGIDLGQLTDYSALATVESTEAAEDGKAVRRHSVRSLHRWPLRTPYGKVVDDTVKVFEKEALTGSALVIDRTGVGVAVTETLVAAKPHAKIVMASITGGEKESYADGCWSVPKRELAGTLQVLLGTRRLEIAEGLTLGATLKRELQRFSVKVNIATGHESFEAWREADHDDIVLAVALACWWAERLPSAATGQISLQPLATTDTLRPRWWR